MSSLETMLNFVKTIEENNINDTNIYNRVQKSNSSSSSSSSISSSSSTRKPLLYNSKN